MILFYQLSDLQLSVPHTILSKGCMPTRFASFLVAVSNDDTSEKYIVYARVYR